MNDFEWINNYYGVHASIGRDITYNGRKATIAKDNGNYLGVIFHDDNKRKIQNCHPTSEIIYLDSFTDLKDLRTKNWRSKERYQKYLEVSECYDSFKDYLKYNK